MSSTSIPDVQITGYRSFVTTHDWGRVVGDVNGLSEGTSTAVHVLVLETDSGHQGYAVGPHHDIDTVFPSVRGADPRGVTACYDRMLATVFKNGHNGSVFSTIGAVDTALWDLKAKLAGEPLWRLLGGVDPRVPAYASGLCAGLSTEQLVAVYGEFAESGFDAAKLKGGLDAEVDVKRLLAVRDVLLRNSPEPALMIDANESWHFSQARRHIARLEREVDLTWVEEPLRRWDSRGLHELRGSIRAGVATGENLTGLEQVRALMTAGAVDVVQPGTVYGITHALRVATLAHAFDLPFSPVGHEGNALAHVGAAMPNHLTTELQDLRTARGLLLDQRYEGGCIVLGDQPGHGITLDEDAVARPEAGAGWATVAGPHVRPVRAGLRLTPPVPVPDGLPAARG